MLLSKAEEEEVAGEEVQLSSVGARGRIYCCSPAGVGAAVDGRHGWELEQLSSWIQPLESGEMLADDRRRRRRGQGKVCCRWRRSPPEKSRKMADAGLRRGWFRAGGLWARRRRKKGRLSSGARCGISCSRPWRLDIASSGDSSGGVQHRRWVWCSIHAGEGGCLREKEDVGLGVRVKTRDLSC